MARREFTAAVKVEIIRRATNAVGLACCENPLCGLPAKKFVIDHIDPDAMQIDKRRALTAEDGWLLCDGPGSCNRAKTAKDVVDIARAKRREAAHLGATRPKGQIKSRGFPKAERAHEPQTKIAAGETQIARQFRTIADD